MANEQNLKSFGERTASERREIAKKAGIASGKKRRHQRDLREAVRAVPGVLLPMKGGGEGKTVAEAVALAVAHKAAKGDLKAATLLWEWLYGKNAQTEDAGAVGIPRVKIDIEMPNSAGSVATAVEPEASCGG